MSDNPKSTRPLIDPNLLGLLVAVVTIIGANVATTSMMSSSLRNEMDARFDSVDRRFEFIDRRFDGIDDRLDGIDDRLDGIDDRLDGFDDRLERINDQLYDLNGRLSRVESGVFGYEPPTSLEAPPEDETAPTPGTGTRCRSTSASFAVNSRSVLEWDRKTS